MQHSSILEALETRRLFAGASFRDSVIRVFGDQGSKNTINVADNGANLDVTITYKDALGINYTSTTSFPTTLTFRKINIFGGIRNDTITVNTTKATRVDSGRGNDTLTLGGERDAVIAGPGNDTVNAGAGADLVYGGAGNDVLTGGDGNDTLFGGNGQDSIDGGAGDDKLGGIAGVPNTLTGGAGADTFAGNLTLNPTNDYNPSEDSLAGNDTGDVDDPSVTPH